MNDCAELVTVLSLYSGFNYYFLCFSDPICPPRSSSGLVHCATNLLSHLREWPEEAPLKKQYPSPLLPQVLEGTTRLLEGTNNLGNLVTGTLIWSHQGPHIVRRPLVLKAPPLDTWRCCFISILFQRIVVSCLVSTEPVFRLLCLMMTVYFLFCFSLAPQFQTRWRSEIIIPHYYEPVK